MSPGQWFVAISVGIIQVAGFVTLVRIFAGVFRRLGLLDDWASPPTPPREDETERTYLH